MSNLISFDPYQMNYIDELEQERRNSITSSLL